VVLLFSYHVSLDVHDVEHLAVVDSHGRADHLGHDDHVAQVRLDDGGPLGGAGGWWGVGCRWVSVGGCGMDAGCGCV
jgi:hypothetical protein